MATLFDPRSSELSHDYLASEQSMKRGAPEQLRSLFHGSVAIVSSARRESANTDDRKTDSMTAWSVMGLTKSPTSQWQLTLNCELTSGIFGLPGISADPAHSSSGRRS